MEEEKELRLLENLEEEGEYDEDWAYYQRAGADEDKNEAAALERRNFLEKEKAKRKLTREEEEQLEFLKDY